MAKQIWKFSTTQNGFKQQFVIDMPEGAEILTIQIDEKTFMPTMWATVNPKNKFETRNFEIIPTDYDFVEIDGIERKYIGTYQIDTGAFVGHLFERIVKL